jgi:pyruvate/2-oxoglutarate dehydrogenase complex dihydrolipoamide dehydrogenase (E3) component
VTTNQHVIVIVARDTHRLLGAHVVGQQAVEIVHPGRKEPS